jgi:hypothetical protein
MGFFCESLGVRVKSSNFLWFGYFGWYVVLLFCCAFFNLWYMVMLYYYVENFHCGCVFSLRRCQCVSLLNYKSVILASVLCNLWCRLTVWFVTHSLNFVIWGFAHDLILWHTAASLELCWWWEVDHFISWLLFLHSSLRCGCVNFGTHIWTCDVACANFHFPTCIWIFFT